MQPSQVARTGSAGGLPHSDQSQTRESRRGPSLLGNLRRGAAVGLPGWYQVLRPNWDTHRCMSRADHLFSTMLSLNAVPRSLKSYSDTHNVLPVGADYLKRSERPGHSWMQLPCHGRYKHDSNETLPQRRCSSARSLNLPACLHPVSLTRTSNP